MNHQVASLVKRLSEVESPLALIDWENRDRYYVAACRVSQDDVPDLIEIARKWADADWPSEALDLDTKQADADLLPVTAWRTLADLKADAAVQPLVEMLRELGGDFDDWVSEEWPHVFGKIGPPAIGPLTRLANDKHVDEFARSLAVHGLRRVADYHGDSRDRIVACLTEMMANAAAGDFEFNTTLLVELVELQAVEAAEPIERAFATDLVDVGMMGDWEDVRRQLGVAGLGLTMPEKPYNSIEEFRLKMGMGIFSDRPIFSVGEIDHGAERAYYDRAYQTFSKSPQAQRVVERHGALSWHGMLLEFGINYLARVVDEMTLGSVQEFVLAYVPGKVSTEPSSAASIIFELAMFWEYLDCVYQLPEAKSIIQWLNSDGLVAELEGDLSDSSNFGLAKSMFMTGRDAGYDMTSQAGLAEFVKVYNESLGQGHAPPASAADQSKVGRNDPCPCGSGKKYKKCCLRR